jgi:hypothetical protein
MTHFSLYRIARLITFVAEREGFEPSIAVTHYAGLANLCLQPLGHLSKGPPNRGNEEREKY